MDSMDIDKKTAQKPDDKGKQSLNILRRAYSENDLSNREQSEKAWCSDLLSQARENREEREKWYAFLEERKEGQQKKLEEQLEMEKKDYSKQAAFRLFEQELKKLMKKAQKAFKEQPQKGVEQDKQAKDAFRKFLKETYTIDNLVEDRLEELFHKNELSSTLAKKAVNNLLKAAERGLKEKQQKLNDNQQLSSVIEQIMKQVDTSQAVINQHIEKTSPKFDGLPLNMCREALKDHVASHLNWILGELKNSLQIAPPLLDYQRLKSHFDQESQELEEGLQSLPEKRRSEVAKIIEALKESKEAFRKLREEERSIFGDHGSFQEEIQIHPPEGYCYYDHVEMLEAEKRCAFEELIDNIHAKYNAKGIMPLHEIQPGMSKEEKERINNIRKHLNKSNLNLKQVIENLENDIVKVNQKIIIDEAYKAYGEYKEAKKKVDDLLFKISQEAERKQNKRRLGISQTVSSQKLGAKKTDSAAESKREVPSQSDGQHSQATSPQDIEKIVQIEQKEASDKIEKYNEKNTAEEKKCEAAENLFAKDQKLKKLDAIIAQKLNDTFLSQYATDPDLQRKLKDYKQTLEKIKESYEALDKWSKKVTDAKNLSLEMKNESQRYKNLCDQIDRIEDLEKQEKYERAKKRLEKFKEGKKPIFRMIDQASQALDEAQKQEKMVRLVIDAFEKKLSSEGALRLYRDLDRKNQEISQSKDTLKVLRACISQKGDDLQKYQEYISAMKNDLPKNNQQYNTYRKAISDLKTECAGLEKTIEAINNEDFKKFNNSGNEHEKRMVQFKINIERMKQKLYVYNENIQKLIEERNKIATYLQQPSKEQDDYQWNKHININNEILKEFENHMNQLKNAIEDYNSISNIIKKGKKIATESIEKYLNDINKDNINQSKFHIEEDNNDNNLLAYLQNYRNIEYNLNHCNNIKDIVKNIKAQIPKNEDSETCEKINNLNSLIEKANECIQKHKNMLQKSNQEEINRFFVSSNKEIDTEFNSQMHKIAKKLTNLKESYAVLKPILDSLNNDVLTLQSNFSQNFSQNLFQRVSSQKSGADQLVNPGQERHDESSSANLPQNIEMILQRIIQRRDSYNECNEFQYLQKAIIQHDTAIEVGLISREMTTIMYKSDEKKFNSIKKAILEENKKYLNTWKNHINDVQLQLDTLKNEYRDKNEQLSSKESELSNIQKEIKELLSQEKALEEKIQYFKQEREELYGSIRERVVQESEANNNPQKSIADLALARITQIYGLTPASPKEARVSPDELSRELDQLHLSSPISKDDGMSECSFDDQDWVTEIDQLRNHLPISENDLLTLIHGLEIGSPTPKYDDDFLRRIEELQLGPPTREGDDLEKLHLGSPTSKDDGVSECSFDDQDWVTEIDQLWHHLPISEAHLLTLVDGLQLGSPTREGDGVYESSSDDELSRELDKINRRMIKIERSPDGTPIGRWQD